MNLEQAFNSLNFWINKYTGSYYTVSELEDLVDLGQMALYSDYRLRASTSQHIKDALAPFKSSYAITPSNSVGGLVTIPEDQNYLDLLDIEIRYAISGRGITKHIPLESYNEDERSERLNSQIDPVTVTSPIMEQVGKGSWQIYPEAQYFGKITFYRRPVKPVYGYSLISGRVIVYNPNTSTELEWAEPQQRELLVKALVSAGINLSDGEVQQWAAMVTNNNYNGINHL